MEVDQLILGICKFLETDVFLDKYQELHSVVGGVFYDWVQSNQLKASLSYFKTFVLLWIVVEVELGGKGENWEKLFELS